MKMLKPILSIAVVFICLVLLSSCQTETTEPLDLSPPETGLELQPKLLECEECEGGVQYCCDNQNNCDDYACIDGRESIILYDLETFTKYYAEEAAEVVAYTEGQFTVIDHNGKQTHFKKEGAGFTTIERITGEVRDISAAESYLCSGDQFVIECTLYGCVILFTNGNTYAISYILALGYCAIT